MKVLTVTITDTTNGTKALVEAVSKIGLLQGDNLIKKKEEEVIALRKQQMAIETQRILYFFTGAFSLLAIFVLFVRLNS
ncbi:MAG: hypothetical protein QG653_676, partial [Patescibacteria group bacterium]|nr:hypothetical protein [Patescibacteria group bacterium]